MSQDIVRESLVNITGWGVAHRARQARSLLHREPRWHSL